MSKGFMTTTELTTCYVSDDPSSHVLAEGYVVAFITPIHPLTAAALQPVTVQSDPSGILHIVTFMTLCEAFMRIDPHFDLWNHFFRVRRPQDPDAEMTVLGA
jgi:hypothetical protein